jgi:hypothetical protein
MSLHHDIVPQRVSQRVWLCHCLCITARACISVFLCVYDDGIVIAHGVPLYRGPCIAAFFVCVTVWRCISAFFSEYGHVIACALPRACLHISVFSQLVWRCHYSQRAIVSRRIFQCVSQHDIVRPRVSACMTLPLRAHRGVCDIVCQRFSQRV